MIRYFLLAVAIAATGGELGYALGLHAAAGYVADARADVASTTADVVSLHNSFESCHRNFETVRSNFNQAIDAANRNYQSFEICRRSFYQLEALCRR